MPDDFRAWLNDEAAKAGIGVPVDGPPAGLLGRESSQQASQRPGYLDKSIGVIGGRRYDPSIANIGEWLPGILADAYRPAVEAIPEFLPAVAMDVLTLGPFRRLSEGIEAADATGTPRNQVMHPADVLGVAYEPGAAGLLATAMRRGVPKGAVGMSGSGLREAGGKQLYRGRGEPGQVNSSGHRFLTTDRNEAEFYASGHGADGAVDTYTINPAARIADVSVDAFDMDEALGNIVSSIASKHNMTTSRFLHSGMDENLSMKARGRKKELLDALTAAGYDLARIPDTHGVTGDRSISFVDLSGKGVIAPQIDDLGYYSQALETARVLPQAKGTPEQMLAQLRNAGVKEAEIEATGLRPFLGGKKSVTRDEIVRHLEEGRVGLKERIYGLTSLDDADDAVRELASELQRMSNGRMTDVHALRMAERFAIPQLPRHQTLDGIEQSIEQMASPELRRLIERSRQKVDDSTYRQNSLDPSNPTYREVVLHLPRRGERLDVRRREIEALGRSATPEQRQEWADIMNRLQPDTRDVEGVQPFAGMPDFTSGHFPEPNIVGHMMTSTVRDSEGRKVYLIDQIQSDWGQRLRDGGVRDEAKIAELKRRLVDFDANRPEWEAQNKARYKVLQPTQLALDKDFQAARRLIEAELRTAEAAVPGNPLVNTTDQWTNTTLRRAIRQAAEDGHDAIAIPSGDTVLSYNPGGEAGMNAFYNDIVPKNLRNLLKRLDKDSPAPKRVGTVESPSGKAGLGKGFTVFEITPKARQQLLTRGQPLFARETSVGYNPLPVRERSFADDYPGNARSDGTGRLEESIEGVKLDAPFVAGRRRVGGVDEGIGGEAVGPLAEALAGSVRGASRQELRGNLGEYRRSGDASSILYDKSLPPNVQGRVLAHEVGHAIDELAGKIPVEGLRDELRVVFSDLATGQQGRSRNLTGPQHMGYGSAESARELMAEAIRAYMVDPNYLKSVAPKTAKRIREMVNRNPRIAKTIQFNVRGGPSIGQPPGDEE